MDRQKAALLCLLFVSIIYLSYFSMQSAYHHIWIPYSIAFTAYFILIQSKADCSLALLILPSLLPMFAFPNLSDDIYRFVWDGYTTLGGYSPYAYTPRQSMELGIAGHTKPLFDLLNSPDYFSIYPSVNQAFFAFITYVSDDLYIQILWLRGIYFALHILGIWALATWMKKRGHYIALAAIYAWHPLVIVEGLANLHIEVVMVAFLYIALYLFDKYPVWSALCFAMAISVKLIPLFLCGYFLVRWNHKQTRSYLIYIACWLVPLFAHVVVGLISGGFMDSVDLYFRKFEFNASVYYALRWLGDLGTGYNLIKYLGPFLFLTFLFLVFRNWIKFIALNTKSNFLANSLWVWTCYFLCSTIVHPWYIIGLLAFLPFIKRWYVLAWSYMIIHTYVNYSFLSYYEVLWIVGLEYAVVILVWFIWDNKLTFSNNVSN